MHEHCKGTAATCDMLGSASSSLLVKVPQPLCIVIHNLFAIRYGTRTRIHVWQSQVDNETLGGLIRLVISLECFIEITPDFLCPFIELHAQ